MFNEYCTVAVTSEAMDGVAPELNPGRVHRRKSSNGAVRLGQKLATTLCNKPVKLQLIEADQ